MELAPFYDISISAIYYDVHKDDIGMKIKNKKTEISVDDLLWLVEIAQIEQQQATEIIKDIALRFIKEFKTYVNKLPDDIKYLPYYAKKSIYNTRKSFVDIFDKYYQHRCAYIRQYLSVDYVEEKFLWE